jgi:hypothetical protein
MHGYSKKEHGERPNADVANSRTFDFYGLLRVSVNQDQVVRTLPANWCVTKTCDVAAYTRIFTELSAGLTTISSPPRSLGQPLE